MIERGAELMEGIAAIDHWLETNLVHRANQIFQSATMTNGDALNGRRFEEQRSRGARETETF
jgi:hypothetical protein